MKPNVYIAGPTLGYKNFNFEKFREMGYDLLIAGFEIRNPHAHCEFQNYTPADSKYYAECIRELTECTDIILLNGWQYSEISQIECKVAQFLKLGIHEDIESLINKYSNQFY